MGGDCTVRIGVGGCTVRIGVGGFNCLVMRLCGTLPR